MLFSSLLCSSMYYDEDGDLAHEFYEETIVTKNGRKRAKLKRIHKNLIPQVTHLGRKSSPEAWLVVYQLSKRPRLLVSVQYDAA